jgi:ABC-type sugar transport system substrate-binding protein
VSHKSLLKLLYVVLSVLIVSTLAAQCGGAPVTVVVTKEVEKVVTAPPVVQTVVVEATAAPAPTSAPAPAAAGKEIVIYMQMGGQQGDPSTLARTNGAKAAAAALGVKLIEQYSGWDPQKMIDQFKEAIAAKPDGIVIMGHPGEDAMGPLVDQAEEMGIIVTSGNNPLPTIEAKYQTKGFGYAGADLHAGGYLTGKAMLAAGLKKGDKALVYDIWHQEGRSKSPQGIYDALTEAGGEARRHQRSGQGAVVGHPDTDRVYSSPSRP